MLFNSIQFLIFFPIVVFLYFILPHRFRWSMLLLASCYFYMSFVPVYILVLILLIVIDYISGICIERTENQKTKKIYLLVSIISTCLILFIFKYFNFFNSNFESLAKLIHWNYPIGFLKLILPIGLSFHTFQSLSYVIEIYKGKQKAEYNFGIYALYVMFFPQLVAGPIERPQNLLHQFYEKHFFDFEKISSGLRLMLWGFFKKLVIADRLAPFVNQVYNDPHAFTGISLWSALFYFAIQIYCDFSGYSDIAVGAARVLGFRLTKNFNLPYFSRSITEFWRRWHITLSSWLKDYVFTPLAFKYRNLGKLGICLSMVITFVLIGLWHGADWTFVLFGFSHGLIICFEFLIEKPRKNILSKIPNYITNTLGIIYTFCIWSLTLIFFRAKDLGDSFYIMGHLFSGVKKYVVDNLLNLSLSSGKLKPFLLGQHREEFMVAVLAIAIMISVHSISRCPKGVATFLEKMPILIRWSFYWAVIFVILFLGVFTESPFIYFQF